MSTLPLFPSPTQPREGSGIYLIRCHANNKAYIGQSAAMHRRHVSHWSTLRRGVHHNPHLQNAWNKYGEESFSFRVVEYVEIEELLAREIQIIEELNCQSPSGFNLTPGGDAGLQGESSPASVLTDAIVEEARKRAGVGEFVKDIASDMDVPYSALVRAVSGTTWSHLPGAVTLKGRQRRGDDWHASILTKEQVTEARRRAAEGEFVTQIADDYGVNAHSLTAAVTGRTWSYLPSAVTGIHARRKGEKCLNAKMTRAQVNEARQRYRDGETIKEITDDFEVTYGNLNHIIKGISWKHVPDAVDGPGRGAKGALNTGAKLTKKQVMNFRDRARDGETIQSIVESSGVSAGCVRRVVNGTRWGHLDGAVQMEAALQKGEERWNSELTESQVIEARKRVHEGESVRKVARDLGLRHGTLLQAVKGNSWSYLPNAVTQDLSMREKGERRWNAKMTEAMVLEGRQRVSNGDLIKDVADDLDVHPATLGDAVRGKSWKHVAGPITRKMTRYHRGKK